MQASFINLVRLYPVEFHKSIIPINIDLRLKPLKKAKPNNRNIKFFIIYYSMIWHDIINKLF